MFESIASIGMMTICMTILYYLSHLIYNNVKAQQQYAIRQGQGGRNGNIMCYASANIEIIRNTRESIKRSFDLVRSAREEVLRIFSSITAFRCQIRVGVLQSIEHGVKVRVLIPADYQQITQIINEVKLVLPDLFTTKPKLVLDVEFKWVDTSVSTKSRICTQFTTQVLS